MTELSFVIPCVMNFYLPETASRAVKVFKKLGYHAHIPENQGCCGYPFLQHGEKSDAKELAQKLLFDFQTGRRNHFICTLSPHCYHTISNSYPKLFHNSVSHNLCQKVISDVVDMYDLLLQHGVQILSQEPSILISDSLIDLQKLAKLTQCNVSDSSWILFNEGYSDAGGQHALPIFNVNQAQNSLEKVFSFAEKKKIKKLVFTDELGLLHANQNIEDKGLDFQTNHILDVLYEQTFG